MRMIGLCGDNCEYCPRYIATLNGGSIELEKVKELWVRLGLRGHAFPTEDIACYGCFPENKCAYAELRECVNEKDRENCGLCDDYPCEHITTAFDKSEILKSRAAKVCTREEMDMLQKAFFSKKEYFDNIHQKHKKIQ